MASETYDYEPFDNTEHSMKQIADAIRHKGYGKDVREAIAQGMEAYDEVSGKLFDRMQKVEEKNSDLEEQANKLKDRCQKLESQVEQLLKDADDHEKRLQKIEQFLFSSQSVSATAISRDDDSEHQGYDVTDAPDYDYQEQEIN